MSAPVDAKALWAIWQDLMTVHGAVDAAVPEDGGVLRVHIDAALGTLSRARDVLEDIVALEDGADAPIALVPTAIAKAPKKTARRTRRKAA